MKFHNIKKIKLWKKKFILMLLVILTYVNDSHFTSMKITIHHLVNFINVVDLVHIVGFSHKYHFYPCVHFIDIVIFIGEIHFYQCLNSSMWLVSWIYINFCGMVHCVINFIHMWVLPLWSISSICEFCLCGQFHMEIQLYQCCWSSFMEIFSHIQIIAIVWLILSINVLIFFLLSRDRFLLMWFYQSMDNFIFMVIFVSISSINNVFVI
jgi:hypothetical protein